MVRTPSLWRIIQNDYIAHMAFLFPVVFWGMYVVFALFRPGESTEFFLYAAPISTVLAVGVLLWRYRTFTTIFSDGLEVPGIVSNAGFFRGRGRIECTYTYQGQKLVSGNAIHETKRSREFKQGTDVTLAVDRNNPKRAFIRDLYL
jgi:hypothetical protein